MLLFHRQNFFSSSIIFTLTCQSFCFAIFLSTATSTPRQRPAGTHCVKYYPRFATWAIFYELREKMSNNDLNGSHYLYTSDWPAAKMKNVGKIKEKRFQTRSYGTKIENVCKRLLQLRVKTHVLTNTCAVVGRWQRETSRTGATVWVSTHTVVLTAAVTIRTVDRRWHNCIQTHTTQEKLVS